MTRRPTPASTPARIAAGVTPARVAATGLCLLLLTGCTTGGDTSGGNTVADQAREVADRAYISGDGRVEALTIDERAEPVTLTGTTLDGQPWSSVDHRGEVVVLNVWGSWCEPCVAEMPELESAWQDMQSEDLPVTFMGINVGESPETGAAFMRRTNTTYPSLGRDGGEALIALQDKASVPPTTLVLDTQGRIAARVAGETTASTLRGLVDDVLAEA